MKQQLPTALGSVIRVTKWSRDSTIKNNSYTCLLTRSGWQFGCDSRDLQYTEEDFRGYVRRGNMEFIVVLDAGAYELTE